MESTQNISNVFDAVSTLFKNFKNYEPFRNLAHFYPQTLMTGPISCHIIDGIGCHGVVTWNTTFELRATWAGASTVEHRAHGHHHFLENMGQRELLSSDSRVHVVIWVASTYVLCSKDIKNCLSKRPLIFWSILHHDIIDHMRMFWYVDDTMGQILVTWIIYSYALLLRSKVVEVFVARTVVWQASPLRG